MMELKTLRWMQHWSDEEFAEYEQAWNDSYTATDDTGERVAMFLQSILDAEQAHRTWAKDVIAEMLRQGSAEVWKRAPRQKPVAVKGGAQVNTQVAAKREDDEGAQLYVQLHIFDMHREELEKHRADISAQLRSYRYKGRLADRLMALIDQAGGDCTAREAAVTLGIDIEAWCAG